MRFSGIIFDCDGVLVDSEKLAVKIDQRLLEELGWSLSLEEIAENFLGKSEEHFNKTVEAHLGQKLSDAWKAKSKDVYRETFEAELQAVPGIEKALADLELGTCVASSGSHEKMRLTLGLTGLLPRFEGRLYSATQVARGKPFPDLFLFAAKQMGWEPAHCVVVEDSAAGIEAALAAGMHVIAYNSGLQDHSNIHHPRLRIIHDMAELVPVITGRSPWKVQQ